MLKVSKSKKISLDRLEIIPLTPELQKLEKGQMVMPKLYR